MEVKCGRCKRTLKNLKTAHRCGDQYFGPGCSEKMDFFSPDEPEVRGHNLEADKALNDFISSERRRQGRSLSEGQEETAKHINELKEVFAEKYEDIYIDPTSNDNIFTRPVHPSFLKNLNTDNLAFVHRPHTPDTGNYAPKKVIMDQEKCGIRAIHCFGKLFEDPTLSREAIKAYNSVGVAIAGYFPIDAKPDSDEFASLLVTSNNEDSQFDRYLNLTVDNLHLKVQLLVLNGKKFEAVTTGELRIPSLWERASNEVCSFDQSLITICHHWFHDPKPLNNEVLLRWRANLRFLDSIKRFKYLK